MKTTTWNNTSEPIKKLVNRELLILRIFQMDAKEIKNPLQWWQKNESIFPIVSFFAWQILGIFGSQIETIFFSLTNIFTNHRRCLQFHKKNLNKYFEIRIGLMTNKLVANILAVE
jgi:hypothetical protein